MTFSGFRVVHVKPAAPLVACLFTGLAIFEVNSCLFLQNSFQFLPLVSEKIFFLYMYKRKTGQNLVWQCLSMDQISFSYFYRRSPRQFLPNQFEFNGLIEKMFVH